jgi:hypothetical protein
LNVCSKSYLDRSRMFPLLSESTTILTTIAFGNSADPEAEWIGSDNQGKMESFLMPRSLKTGLLLYDECELELIPYCSWSVKAHRLPRRQYCFDNEYQRPVLLCEIPERTLLGLRTLLQVTTNLFDTWLNACCGRWNHSKRYKSKSSIHSLLLFY